MSSVHHQAPAVPSTTIECGPSRPALRFYTGSGSHPIKPPQPGVFPKIIGESDTIGSFVRIIGRDVEVADAVRLTAYRGSQGQPQAKLNVGLRTAAGPAPGLPFRGEGIEGGGDLKFWNPEVRGPVFVAVAQTGPYLTNVSGDANIVRGYRAGLISAPGQLEFARAADQRSSSMEILLQGHEELRNQPGSFLSKAIVAYPVDAAGSPSPASLVALRTFQTKAPPAGDDRAAAWVSMPFMTPKYLFEVHAGGRFGVAQIDGLKAVKEARKVAAAQT